MFNIRERGFVATPYFLLALGLSVAGNVLLWHLRDNAIKEGATYAAERDQSRQAAQACSDGVAKLEEEGKARNAAAQKAVAAAAVRARAAESRAQAILASGPAVAGDACRSAAMLNTSQIRARRIQPKGKP